MTGPKNLPTLSTKPVEVHMPGGTCPGETHVATQALPSFAGQRHPAATAGPLLPPPGTGVINVAGDSLMELIVHRRVLGSGWQTWHTEPPPSGRCQKSSLPQVPQIRMAVGEDGSPELFFANSFPSPGDGVEPHRSSVSDAVSEEPGFIFIEPTEPSNSVPAWLCFVSAARGSRGSIAMNP